MTFITVKMALTLKYTSREQHLTKSIYQRSISILQDITQWHDISKYFQGPIYLHWRIQFSYCLGRFCFFLLMLIIYRTRPSTFCRYALLQTIFAIILFMVPFLFFLFPFFFCSLRKYFHKILKVYLLYYIYSKRTCRFFGIYWKFEYSYTIMTTLPVYLFQFNSSF